MWLAVRLIGSLETAWSEVSARCRDGSDPRVLGLLPLRSPQIGERDFVQRIRSGLEGQSR